MFKIVLICILIKFISMQKVCEGLQISSDILLSQNDIVKDGLPVDKWLKKAQNPVIISSSMMIDYLYVGFVDEALEPTFKLNYNNHQYANSSLQVLTKSDGIQTLEIAYLCKENSGALLDFDLEVEVAGCGSTRIYWKKVCGNPLTPRGGLTMDVAYKQYNQTIVRDGLLVDASYFDRDLDNYVFQVPSGTKQTKFYLYMNDSSTEVTLSTPILDADTEMVNPIIAGQLADGGVITKEAQSIIINYNCLHEADTVLELSMPLDYYRDLNLVFVKKCPSMGATTSTLIWLLSGLFLLGGFGWLYNILVGHKSGFKAMPCSTIIITALLKFEFVKKLTHQPFQYQNTDEEEYESDFKIQRVNKYDSI